MFKWSKSRMEFHIAGWMKNGLCRKLICCSNCVLLKLNNVYSYIKRRWVSLNEPWPSAGFPIQGSWVENSWVAPSSTQPFFLLRSTKWALRSPRDWVLKSKSWTPSIKTARKVFFKRKNFKLNMTDWPCHAWLQKKISMTNHQGRLRGVLPTFMHKFGWWDFVYFVTKL